MNKRRITAIGATAVLSLALLGWGVTAGAEEVMGVVVREGDARIEVADQPGAKGSVTIREVEAPAGSFLVVHQSEDGKPGMRLGYAEVEKGLGRDVVVELDPEVALTPELLVALHVDRGKKGELEFDMENMEHSPDRPYFIGGKEVAASFDVGGSGEPAGMDEPAEMD